MREKKQSGLIRVGSQVTFDFATREVTATVLEDRGPIGAGGKTLLRVRIDSLGIGEPIETEIHASRVKPAA